ncbi:MAG: hypothetical protein ACRC10_01355 [Thermoguttaceae bacterium]
MTRFLGSCTLLLIGFMPVFLKAEEIKHRFLALDESRAQILFVDQFDPTQNWSIPLETSCRDMQLIDGKIVIGLLNGGFREYDFLTQKLIREVVHRQYSTRAVSVTAFRVPNGDTYLAIDRVPLEIAHLDTEGKAVAAPLRFPDLQGVRCMRLTKEGSLIFGDKENIHIVTPDGQSMKTINVPDAQYVYMIEELPDGNYLASCGYSAFLGFVDSKGKLVKKWGGKPGPENLNFHFFAGFQVLPNGHVIVCNWTGHGANDSEKGCQLVEFDRQGEVVWSWHDPKMAGSIHNVVVLDSNFRTETVQKILMR